MESTSHSQDPGFKNSSWESHYNRMMTYTCSLDEGRNKSSLFTSIHDRAVQSMKELVTKYMEVHFRNLNLNGILLLIKQFDFMMKLLRCLVEGTYGPLIENCIGQDTDLYPERVVCAQRIVEHFMLSKDYPLHCIMSCLVERYYKGLAEESPATFKGSGASLFTVSQEPTVPILDKTLHPKSQPEEFMLDLGSMEDSSLQLYRDEFHQPMLCGRENHQAQYLALIERSEKVVTQSQVPYSQTFPLILRILKVRKYWKKFKLIERLDRQIVFLFMRRRTESQYDQCFDMISAEDSKSEILFYLLYSFQKTYPQVNFHRDLYLTLRVMNDFDGCLHQDLKFVFCPDFLRFFNILEMIITNSEM